jgi:hypothetical protein
MASWTDLVHKFLGHGKYNATLPTYNDGQAAEVQTDSRGRIITVSATPTNSTVGTTWSDEISAGAQAKLVTATANKSFVGGFWTNTEPVSGYVMLFNLASTGSLSSGVTEPFMAPIPIAANGFVAVSLPRARVFSTGIVWAISSTPDVYTSSTAAAVASVEYQ